MLETYDRVKLPKMLEAVYVTQGGLAKLKMKLRQFVVVERLDPDSTAPKKHGNVWPDGIWKGVKLVETCLYQLREGEAWFAYDDGSHEVYKLW